MFHRLPVESPISSVDDDILENPRIAPLPVKSVLIEGSLTFALLMVRILGNGISRTTIITIVIATGLSITSFDSNRDLFNSRTQTRTYLTRPPHSFPLSPSPYFPPTKRRLTTTLLNSPWLSTPPLNTQTPCSCIPARRMPSSSCLLFY